jgi:hypothetical protein
MENKKTLEREINIIEILTESSRFFILEKKLQHVPFLLKKYQYEAKGNTICIDSENPCAWEFVIDHIKHSGSKWPSTLTYPRSKKEQYTSSNPYKPIEKMVVTEVDEVRRLADFLMYEPLCSYLSFRPTKTQLHIQCGYDKDHKLFYTLIMPHQYLRMRLNELENSHYQNDIICSFSLSQRPIIQVSQFTTLKAESVVTNQAVLNKRYLYPLPDSYESKTAFEISALLNKNLCPLLNDLGYGLSGYHMERTHENTFYYTMNLDVDVYGMLQIGYNSYSISTYMEYLTLYKKEPRALIIDHYFTRRSINYIEDATVLYYPG